MKRAGIHAAWLVCALLAPAASAAPLDRFALHVGGFASRLETSLHFSETDFYDATSVDFDEELALDEENIVEFVGISSRPWPRHQFDINYFDQQMSGTRRLQRDLVFEGERFVIHSVVRSRLGIRAIEFSYTWWAVLEPDWAFGLRLGYMDYQLHASIGLLLSADGERPELMAVASFDEHVPVPSLGLDFRYRMAPGWRLKFRVGWLERKLSSVSPRVVSFHAGAEYLPWENFGAWVDFGVNRLDVETRRDTYNGAVRLDEGGVRVGVAWRF